MYNNYNTNNAFITYKAPPNYIKYLAILVLNTMYKTCRSASDRCTNNTSDMVELCNNTLQFNFQFIKKRN